VSTATAVGVQPRAHQENLLYTRVWEGSEKRAERVSRADDRAADVRSSGGSGRRDQSLERWIGRRGYYTAGV